MSKQGDNRNIRVLQFLDAYEKQENLWNPVLESYKNKAARDESYMQIIRELNVPSLTIHDIKLKVKSIRTTYTKELRLLTKHKEEGKAYSPKLFWFNRANAFLKSVSLSREKRTSYPGKVSISPIDYKPCAIDYITEIPHRDDLAGDTTDGMPNAEELGNTTSTTYEYKTLPCRANTADEHMQEDVDMATGSITEEVVGQKYVNQQDTDFQQQVEATIVNSKYNTTTATDMLHTSNAVLHNSTPSLLVTPSQSTPIHNNTGGNGGEDEYDVFCRSVAAQLRGIHDTYSRSVAKLKIQQILFEAETGHYRNSPCITIPVNQHITNI